MVYYHPHLTVSVGVHPLLSPKQLGALFSLLISTRLGILGGEEDPSFNS